MDRQPAHRLEQARRRTQEAHHDRHHEHARDDEHPAVRQLHAEFERQRADQEDRSQAARHTHGNGGAVAFEEERLQEQRRLEALTVHRQEADAQERHEFPALPVHALRGLAQAADLRVPADPVEFVEHPVGDDQEDDHRQDGNTRLQLLAVMAERLDERLREPESDQGRADGQPRAQGDPPAGFALLGPAQTG